MSTSTRKVIPYEADGRYTELGGVIKTLSESPNPIIAIPCDVPIPGQVGDVVTLGGARVFLAEEVTETAWRNSHDANAGFKLSIPMKFYRVSID